MTSGPDLPFGPDDVEEIHLEQSPLAEVLAQVRFPPIAALARQDTLAGFQGAIRSAYPVLRQEHQLGVVITPQGISAAPQEAAGVLWRFTDVASIWNITVAPNFIALETKQYTTRDDFFTRFREALVAFDEHVKPGLYDRLGVRYVNRLAGPEWLEALPELIRPDVLGLLGGTDARAGGSLQAGQSAVQYRLDDAVMLVRTARLPAGTGYDPSVPPAAADSWLLDLDMSTQHTSPRPFVPDELANLGRSFAGAIYRYFRWSVLPELLRRAGAEK